MDEGRRSVLAQEYDAIVIGSGIGGLATAGLLARLRGWRVLVLEQHFTVGGLTHEFKRKGRFAFDVGLHYVGNMREGTAERRLFDYLSDGQLQWQRMPDAFDRFVYPGLTFDHRAPSRQFVADLCARFPDEAPALGHYLRDVMRAARWWGAAHMRDAMPPVLRLLLDLGCATLGRSAFRTTAAYLARTFRDPALRAVLASQWGDQGLPPSRSAFGIQATIVAHYLRGGWYPVGGAGQIARTMIPGIERAGGAVLGSRRVTRILVEGGAAVGVVVAHAARPREPEIAYRAPVIVSNAGAANTFLRLLPEEVPIPFREALRQSQPGASAITLYAGLRDSPAALGVKGENYWIFRSFDHDHAELGPDGEPGVCYVSFPSMKNPHATGHTAELIAFAQEGVFERWRATAWKRRGPEYERFKSQLGDRLLETVERVLPGFTALVEYREVSTPLTVEHFHKSAHGAFYGVPCTPDHPRLPWVGSRTPVPGLYLTGQDAMMLGIVGALMAGVKTAGILYGPLGFFRLMAAVQREMAKREKAVTPRGAG